MTKIVKIINNEPLVSTLDMYEGLGVTHTAIIKLIKKYEPDFQELGDIHFLQAESTGGRPLGYYYLNENQTTFLIAMMRNNNKIRKSLITIVQNFKKAKKSLRLFIDSLRDFDFDDIKDRFVYAAMDSQGRIKIGISINPEQRVKQLNIGNADQLKLIYTKKAESSGYKDETDLHKKCKAFNIRSEWFANEAIKFLK